MSQVKSGLRIVFTMFKKKKYKSISFKNLQINKQTPFSVFYKQNINFEEDGDNANTYGSHCSIASRELVCALQMFVWMEDGFNQLYIENVSSSKHAAKQEPPERMG